MDFEGMGQDLLRALRGTRSQVALSRRLGFRTNVIYTWEAGRRGTPFHALWRIAAKVDVDIGEVLTRFLTVVPPSVSAMRMDTPVGCAALLDALGGDQSLGTLAVATGHSRHALSRWTSGRAEPTLAQALAFIEASTRRSLDFVACFTDPSALSSTRDAWHTLAARRAITYAHPWSPAVLRALELRAYESLPAHQRGWIASRIGITEEDEHRCLTALLEAGLIRWEGARYVGVAVTVDTRPGPEPARRAAKQHWARVGIEHLTSGAPGLYSYNVMGVSRADLARIEALHAAYFHALRAIVAESTPVECVAVVNLQLFELTTPLPAPAGSST
jgi:transcriptional regulator with XRE-family HTH domain